MHLQDIIQASAALRRSGRTPSETRLAETRLRETRDEEIRALAATIENDARLSETHLLGPDRRLDPPPWHA